jgi:hypothetical protein
MFRKTSAYRHSVLDDAYYAELELELQKLSEGVQRHDFEVPTSTSDGHDQAVINQKWGAKMEHDSLLLEKNAR